MDSAKMQLTFWDVKQHPPNDYNHNSNKNWLLQSLI